MPYGIVKPHSTAVQKDTDPPTVTLIYFDGLTRCYMDMPVDAAVTLQADLTNVIESIRHQDLKTLQTEIEANDHLSTVAEDVSS